MISFFWLFRWTTTLCRVLQSNRFLQSMIHWWTGFIHERASPTCCFPCLDRQTLTQSLCWTLPPQLPLPLVRMPSFLSRSTFSWSRFSYQGKYMFYHINDYNHNNNNNRVYFYALGKVKSINRQIIIIRIIIIWTTLMWRIFRPSRSP